MKKLFTLLLEMCKSANPKDISDQHYKDYE